MATILLSEILNDFIQFCDDSIQILIDSIKIIMDFLQNPIDSITPTWFIIFIGIGLLAFHGNLK